MFGVLSIFAENINEDSKLLMNMNAQLEVCAGSYESVVAARRGGAARIELCSALSEGGITPSVGLMEAVVAVPDIRKHVLIRPRGGDFLYTEQEVDIMERDILAARRVGMDGVVIGALTAEGDIDEEAVKRLVLAAGDMNVTFHRAFDLCRCPEEALETIVRLGCSRVLTSGLAATAEAGIPLLRQLVEQAARRIVIMPGCGVNAGNAARIVRETGVVEIHASARSLVKSAMRFRRESVAMGKADSDEYSRMETDVAAVAAIVAEINRA